MLKRHWANETLITFLEMISQASRTLDLDVTAKMPRIWSCSVLVQSSAGLHISTSPSIILKILQIKLNRFLNFGLLQNYGLARYWRQSWWLLAFINVYDFYFGPPSLASKCLWLRIMITGLRRAWLLYLWLKPLYNNIWVFNLHVMWTYICYWEKVLFSIMLEIRIMLYRLTNT